MDNNLIGEGIELMLYGMGTVVVFLTLLVFVTAGMSALVRRFFPLPPEPAAVTTSIAAQPDADSKVMAVIAAALHRHRSSKHKRDSKP